MYHLLTEGSQNMNVYKLSTVKMMFSVHQKENNETFSNMKVGLAWIQLWKHIWHFRSEMETCSKVQKQQDFVIGDIYQNTGKYHAL
jgi:hypothetical protein